VATRRKRRAGTADYRTGLPREREVSGGAIGTANRQGMERAVADFLRAAGLDLGDPNMRETPARVASAWLDEFLDGYRTTPEEILRERYPVERSDDSAMVVITHLEYRSVCPHHLLPYRGRAHVAYVPDRAVVGFGRLSALVDCLAHRLILQEDLARQVARSLSRELGSPATACVLEAEMTCLRLRGEYQHQARTHCEAYEGRFRRDGPLRRELWARIGAGS
jgi:GTP cyclohydrolase I